MVPGTQVLGLASRARARFVVVAPYIKVAALGRVLEAVDPQVPIEVCTRWRVDEIALGVSDLEVWGLVKRRGGSVLLCPSLHGKLYLTEREAIMGSANMTGAALGWSMKPNLELVMSTHPTSPEIDSFLQSLRAQSFEVSEGMRRQFELLVNQYRSAVKCPIPVPEVSMPDLPEAPAGKAGNLWLPRSSNPEAVMAAYLGGTCSGLTPEEEADLVAFELPIGLAEEAARAIIAAMILQLPIVQVVDHHAVQPQRFGAMTDLVQRREGLSRLDAKIAWQSLMRWLLFLFPERYISWVDRYTEMFQKVNSEIPASPETVS